MSAARGFAVALLLTLMRDCAPAVALEARGGATAAQGHRGQPSAPKAIRLEATTWVPCGRAPPDAPIVLTLALQHDAAGRDKLVRASRCLPACLQDGGSAGYFNSMA